VRRKTEEGLVGEKDRRWLSDKVRNKLWIWKTEAKWKWYFFGEECRRSLLGKEKETIAALCILFLSWFWILRAFVTCFFSFFLSRRKSRQVETCFAPYPFTWHSWHFSARPFLLFLCPPTPSNYEAYRISPRFRQSGPSSPRSWSVSSFVFLLKFVQLVAASCRILYSCDPFCFSNLKPSCVILCDLLYFIFNTIQCGVCHRVAKKIVCESFLGNNNNIEVKDDNIFRSLLIYSGGGFLLSFVN
jgi:hypothetical protein